VTYRYLPHTADIKVAIEAPSLEAVLLDAVTLTRQLLVGESPVETREQQPVRLEATNAEDLLLHFLRDILYRYETSGFVPAGLTVEHLDTAQLEGKLLGEPFDGARHTPEPEVKAVTRHGLTVTETEEGWYAEVVFDV
jgi:SHS2 domain-containing protein